MSTWIGSPNYTTGRQGVNIDRIYIHWMVGTLASTDAVFQNTSVGTSAHYGIENGSVHQYVAEQNTAYHAGTWPENLRSIGIEHSAAPGRDATPQTLETSAQLIADICKRYSIPCDRSHIRKHSENIATQCPGSILIDWLVARANQILQGGSDMAIIQNTPNWKARFWKIHHMFIPWDMSDEVFNSIVGQQDFKVVENWNDHPAVQEQLQNIAIGKLARKDDWEGQIHGLVAQVNELSKRPTQEQLDALTKQAADLQASAKAASDAAATAKADAQAKADALAKNEAETAVAKKAADNFFTAILNKIFNQFK